MRRTEMWKWFPTPGRAVTASPLPEAADEARARLTLRARLGRLSAEQRSVLRETLAESVSS